MFQGHHISDVLHVYSAMTLLVTKLTGTEYPHNHKLLVNVSVANNHAKN